MRSPQLLYAASKCLVTVVFGIFDRHWCLAEFLDVLFDFVGTTILNSSFVVHVKSCAGDDSSSITLTGHSWSQPLSAQHSPTFSVENLMCNRHSSAFLDHVVHDLLQF